MTLHLQWNIKQRLKCLVIVSRFYISLSLSFFFFSCFSQYFENSASPSWQLIFWSSLPVSAHWCWTRVWHNDRCNRRWTVVKFFFHLRKLFSFFFSGFTTAPSTFFSVWLIDWSQRRIIKCKEMQRTLFSFERMRGWKTSHMLPCNDCISFCVRECTDFHQIVVVVVSAAIFNENVVRVGDFLLTSQLTQPDNHLGIIKWNIW